MKENKDATSWEARGDVYTEAQTAHQLKPPPAGSGLGFQHLMQNENLVQSAGMCPPPARMTSSSGKASSQHSGQNKRSPEDLHDHSIDF